MNKINILNMNRRFLGKKRKFNVHDKEEEEKEEDNDEKKEEDDDDEEKEEEGNEKINWEMYELKKEQFEPIEKNLKIQ